MAKRKNARTKATRKATTAARKPATKRAATASRAKGASASSRAAGRKKTAPATRKAGKTASKKTVKTAKKAAARGTATRAASTRAKAMKPVKSAKAAKATKAARKAASPVKASKASKASKAVKAAKVSKTARAAAPKTKRAPAPIVAIAAPAAPAEAVAKNGSPAKAPRKAAKRDSAGARERATTRHSEPSVDRPSIPSSLTVDRSASQARSGRQEMREQIKEHTESSPALTAGDVDADWEQAYSSGDEAPGGDNPTPDQDRVDEIGHALGVEYQEGEELKGADKISERDRHRWELDPASSEDYPDRDS
jgi:hypothetical protein